MRILDKFYQDKRPLVVGAISDPAILDETIPDGHCDLIELRLDSLGTGAAVAGFCKRHAGRLPLLLTARHPDEGGANALSAPERASALATLLDHAAAIDLELRSLAELKAVWAEAESRGLTRIASFHNFDATPTLEELSSTIEAAATAGADIGKLAVHLNGLRDLQRLTELLESPASIPRSVMGMGPLAPSSRLLAAQLGSVLNYGFLGRAPTAPGQWPARLLKEALAATPSA